MNSATINQRHKNDIEGLTVGAMWLGSEQSLTMGERVGAMHKMMTMLKIEC